jgi:hypothetical protein
MTTLTVSRINEAINSYFHLNDEQLQIVNEAQKRGYILRPSHTQAEWTVEGFAKAIQELEDKKAMTNL